MKPISMMCMFRFGCWLMLLGLLSIPVQAQQIQANARLDTQALRIGEPLGYTLTVSHDPSWQVLWPQLVDSLGGFDIIDSPQIDTVLQGGNLQQALRLTLMAFDSGSYRIPEVTLDYLVPSQPEPEQISVSGFTVPVFTVPVDTTSDIMAIKGIQQDLITWQEIALNVGLGLAILALLAVIIWLVIRYRREEPIIPQRPRPQIPPHEIAMRRLGELESQKLWQQGEIKAYHAEISTILRGYIEARFQVPALESVTDEILRDLRPFSLPDRLLSLLQDMLQMADLAKYAKSQPLEQENLMAMEHAREFVRNTQALSSPEAESASAPEESHPTPNP